VWVGRYGKPGPVIVVDTPEAEEEIRESYPVESTTFIRTYKNMGSFPNVGKPAGLVQVYSPAVEAAVRDEYPASTIKFVRVYDGQPAYIDGLAAPKVSAAVVASSIIGLVLGLAGFLNRNKPWGPILMGSGSSMIGTSVVLMLRDISN